MSNRSYESDHEDYVYRFRCGQCKTSSEWFDTPDPAREAAGEHEDSHDDLFYPTAIQRFPEDDPVVVRSRD